MDIPWDDVRMFLAVAETKSLSGAARRMRVGQPTVSRRLAQLEEALGHALFRRSVEGASLTTAGEKMLEPARRMAEWAGEVERSAEGGQPLPRGIVRITAPPGVAFDFVAPFAGWLRQDLPDVRLEVISATQYLDLGRREADLALRTRAPEQRDLVRVATLEHDNAVFATKAYRARLPRRYGIADIDWIGWAPPFEALPPNPELAAMVPGFRPAFASDDYLVQYRAAEAGVGAIILGRVRHRFSRDSPLEELDIDLGPHARGALHLVAAKSALDVPRVRAVADRLCAELRTAKAPPRARPVRRT